MPLFKRSEHNEQFTDAFHGQGGPLNVTYPRHDSPINQMFLEARRMHGLAANPDYNGAEQEGAFLYQVTQRGDPGVAAPPGLPHAHLSRPNLKVVTQAVAASACCSTVSAPQASPTTTGGQLRQVRPARRCETVLAGGAFGSRVIPCSRASARRRSAAPRHRRGPCCRAWGRTCRSASTACRPGACPAYRDLRRIAARRGRVAAAMLEWRRRLPA
ncbi:MAG: GMC family oxidoreductase N-terminal domain-containing protein [Inhella sp.]